MKKIYLDHSATTTPIKGIESLLRQHYHTLGNPSSVHSFGQLARSKIEEARYQIAKQLSLDNSGNVIFTSSGLKLIILF